MRHGGVGKLLTRHCHPHDSVKCPSMHAAPISFSTVYCRETDRTVLILLKNGLGDRENEVIRHIYTDSYRRRPNTPKESRPRRPQPHETRHNSGNFHRLDRTSRSSAHESARGSEAAPRPIMRPNYMDKPGIPISLRPSSSLQLHTYRAIHTGREAYRMVPAISCQGSRPIFRAWGGSEAPGIFAARSSYAAFDGEGSTSQYAFRGLPILIPALWTGCRGLVVKRGVLSWKDEARCHPAVYAS